eukprot:g815.t1
MAAALLGKVKVHVADGNEIFVRVPKTYTFRQLLIDALRCFAPDTKGQNADADQRWGGRGRPALVDPEGREWPLDGEVLEYLDARLTARLRGIRLAFIESPEEDDEQRHAVEGDAREGEDVPSSGAPTANYRDSVTTESNDGVHVGSHRNASLESEQKKCETPSLYDELWKIFCFYCVNGRSPDTSMKEKALCNFVQDCQLLRKGAFDLQHVALVYRKRTSGDHRMDFDQFLDSIADIAMRLTVSNQADHEASFGQVLSQYILPRAHRLEWGNSCRQWRVRHSHIEAHAPIFQKMSEPLLDVYRWYAGRDRKFNTSSGKSARLDDRIQRSCGGLDYLSLSDFQQFVLDFSLFDLGLNTRDVAEVFLSCAGENGGCSIAHRLHFSDAVNSLRQESAASKGWAARSLCNFHGFIESIGHLAFIGCARMYNLPDLAQMSVDADLAGERILKCILHYMAIHVSKAASKLMRADYGSVHNLPEKSEVVHTAAIFSQNFLDIQRADGLNDYMDLYKIAHVAWSTESVANGDASSYGRRLETMFQSRKPLPLRRRGSQLDSKTASQKRREVAMAETDFGIAASFSHADHGHHRVSTILRRNMAAINANVVGDRDRTAAVHATPSGRSTPTAADPTGRDASQPRPFTPEPDSYRLWNVGSLNANGQSQRHRHFSEEEKARHVFESLSEADDLYRAEISSDVVQHSQRAEAADEKYYAALKTSASDISTISLDDSTDRKCPPAPRIIRKPLFKMNLAKAMPVLYRWSFVLLDCSKRRMEKLGLNVEAPCIIMMLNKTRIQALPSLEKPPLALPSFSRAFLYKVVDATKLCLLDLWQSRACVDAAASSVDGDGDDDSNRIMNNMASSRLSLLSQILSVEAAVMQIMAFSLKKLGETTVQFDDEMLMPVLSAVNHSMEGNGFDLGDEVFKTSSVVSLTLAQIVAESTKLLQWASTYCAQHAAEFNASAASLNHWAISLYRLATLGDLRRSTSAKAEADDANARTRQLLAMAVKTSERAASLDAVFGNGVRFLKAQVYLRTKFCLLDQSKGCLVTSEYGTGLLKKMQERKSNLRDFASSLGHGKSEHIDAISSMDLSQLQAFAIEKIMSDPVPLYDALTAADDERRTAHYGMKIKVPAHAIVGSARLRRARANAESPLPGESTEFAKANNNGNVKKVLARRDSRRPSLVLTDSAGHQPSWYGRFVDYFLVFGAKAAREPQSSESPRSSMPSPGSSRGAYDLCVEPGLLEQYPRRPYPDMPVPEQMADFCFPLGLSLCTAPEPPSLFHVVLTDITKTALYGTCLHWYERVQPHEVAAWLSSPMERSTSGVQSQSRGHFPSWLNLQDVSKNPPMYAPRCMCVLSHWSFFEIFRIFLSQLLRIGYSVAPLHIERYIANFMCDIPLPPRGLTSVQYTLADASMIISRPPPNELPLCNISLRPLFLCLDLENISRVVGALLTETSIVLCCSKLSLLTTVSEALRSLIFPFDWQCIYIPVVPHSCYELLFSPVPYFMGLNTDFEAEEELHSISDTLFVDLDRNALHCNGQMGPPLPDKLRKSLISRLKKCTCTADPGHPDLEHADLVFKSENPDEQMVGPPLSLDDFATTSGRTVVTRPDNVSDKRFRTISTDESDSISSSEVRKSFLNMFALLMSSYRRHLKKGSEASSSASLSASSLISIGSSANSIMTFNSPDRENAYQFDKASFVHEHKSHRDFLSSMCETQLFEVFIEARIGTSGNSDPLAQSEIEFFDEVIEENKPRGMTSRLNLTHHESSYLRDKSKSVRGTFVVPAPSRVGAGSTSVRKYANFPKVLRDENFGPIREANFLCDCSPEVKEAIQRERKLQSRSSMRINEENQRRSVVVLQTMALFFGGIGRAENVNDAVALLNSAEAEWQNLDLSYNGVGPQESKRLLLTLSKSSCNISSVELQNLSKSCLEDEGAASIITASLYNPNIKALHLDGNKLTDASLSLLAEIIVKQTSLQTLSLSWNDFTDKGVTPFAKALVSSSLTSLDLGYSNVGCLGAKEIASALQNKACPLRSLNLEENYIHRDGTEALCKSLRRNFRLNELFLFGNFISDDGATSLATMLSENRCLRRLDIGSCRIREVGALQIAKGILSNTVLQDLSIGNNHIGLKGKVALARSLTRCSISRLDISSTDTTFQAISPIITSSKNIIAMNLSENPIGDLGATHLASALKSSLQSLCHLSVRNCEITDLGARALSQSLVENSTLQHLDISANHLLTRSSVDSFATSLSSNRVIEEVDMQNIPGMYGKSPSERIVLRCAISRDDGRDEKRQLLKRLRPPPPESKSEPQVTITEPKFDSTESLLVGASADLQRGLEALDRYRKKSGFKGHVESLVASNITCAIDSLIDKKEVRKSIMRAAADFQFEQEKSCDEIRTADDLEDKVSVISSSSDSSSSNCGSESDTEKAYSEIVSDRFDDDFSRNGNDSSCSDLDLDSPTSSLKSGAICSLNSNCSSEYTDTEEKEG